MAMIIISIITIINITIGSANDNKTVFDSSTARYSSHALIIYWLLAAKLHTSSERI